VQPRDRQSTWSFGHERNRKDRSGLLDRFPMRRTIRSEVEQPQPLAPGGWPLPRQLPPPTNQARPRAHVGRHPRGLFRASRAPAAGWSLADFPISPREIRAQQA
jgi:hypothetical protein